MARSVSRLPGGILCQGEAPEGCGNGIRSNRCCARSMRNFRPMTSSSLGQFMNCAIANLPTGMISRGRKILISSSIQDEQLQISSDAGTRSPPLGVFPGKHRHTAAKYNVDLTVD